MFLFTTNDLLHVLCMKRTIVDVYDVNDDASDHCPNISTSINPTTIWPTFLRSKSTALFDWLCGLVCRRWSQPQPDPLPSLALPCCSSKQPQLLLVCFYATKAQGVLRLMLFGVLFLTRICFRNPSTNKSYESCLKRVFETNYG